MEHRGKVATAAHQKTPLAMHARIQLRLRSAQTSLTGVGAVVSGLLQRTWQWLATVRAAILAGRVLIMAVAVLALIDIWQEWDQNEVIIEPAPVPEAVAKAGWTSEVVARQIKDEIHKIDQAGRTDYPHGCTDSD